MTEQAMGTAGDTPTPRLSELGVATCAAAQKAREVANMVTAAVEHITGMAPEAQPTTDTGEHNGGHPGHWHMPQADRQSDESPLTHNATTEERRCICPTLLCSDPLTQ